jgi:hypothetical protein
MRPFKKTGPFSACAVILSLSFFVVSAAPAGAVGATTLTFKEIQKGSTFHFVDNPPEATLKNGALFSPGDMLVSTNPLAMEGKIVGKIRTVCTATGSGTTKKPAAAGFYCTGIAKIPGGSLVLVGEAGEGPGEGAITGGTGTYAGARGTFLSRPARGFSTTTVTLLE